MRTMYDSTAAADIPASAEIVAGYDDGDYAWSGEDWARFPNAIHVHIAVFHSTDSGDVLDIEKGCSETWCAPVWTRMRRAAGLAVPTMYCRRDMGWPDPYNQQAVIDALVAGGVDPGSVGWWLADYRSGAPGLLPGEAAHQWAGDATSGGHYDLSVVSNTAPWMPRVVVPPLPPVPAQVQTATPMKGDDVIPVKILIPALDAEGNGYVDVPHAAGRVTGIVINAADPVVNGYVPLPPKYGALDLGTTARIVIEGGAPRGELGLTVWLNGQ